MVLEDNPNKVGVRFDKPVYGGNNLVDLCEEGHGYFCNGGYFLVDFRGPSKRCGMLFLDARDV